MQNDDPLVSLVKNFTKPLLSWAVMKVSDKSDAEDLVQDTFLVAAEKYEMFRNESSPKTWLFSILNRKIADYYRKKAQFTKVNIHSEDDDDEYFDNKGHWIPGAMGHSWSEDQENLMDNLPFVSVFNTCLEALPVEWKICVTLKYLEEKDAVLICQELSISNTNYWQIIRRAKLKLRDCLQNHWFTKNRN